MKIYEVCLFKSNKKDRKIASICANSEQEAIKKAMDQRQILIRTPDWVDYTDITAEFTHFIEENVWTNVKNLNQVVCEAT